MTSTHTGHPLCHCRRHVGAAVTAAMAAALLPPLPPSPLPLPLPRLPPSPPPPALFPLLLLPHFVLLQHGLPSKNRCHRVLSATPRHFCKKNQNTTIKWMEMGLEWRCSGGVGGWWQQVVVGRRHWWWQKNSKNGVESASASSKPRAFCHVHKISWYHFRPSGQLDVIPLYHTIVQV